MLFIFWIGVKKILKRQAWSLIPDMSQAGWFLQIQFSFEENESQFSKRESKTVWRVVAVSIGCFALMALSIFLNWVTNCDLPEVFEMFLISSMIVDVVSYIIRFLYFLQKLIILIFSWGFVSLKCMVVTFCVKFLMKINHWNFLMQSYILQMHLIS